MTMIVVWLAVIVVALALEAVTTQMVSIWFVGGGLVGLVTELLNVPPWTQVLIASIAVLLLLIFTRPLVNKKLTVKRVHTNADQYIGQTALVTIDINNLENQGEIKVRGSVWTARSDTQDYIAKDTMVRILRIEGVKMIVQRV